MSKTKKNQILSVGAQNLIFFSFAIFLIAPPAFAEQPQMLGLVPCFANCTPCDLWILANNIVFFLTFYLATPVFVVALLAAGIVLLSSSGNPAQIEKGKKILTSSIIGIFIAFGGFLIVDTIIKTLAGNTSGNFQGVVLPWNQIEECPAPITPPPPAPTPTPTPTPGTFQTEEAARTYLKSLGFSDADLKPPCSQGQTTDCLNLAGLPKYVADRLWTLQTACGSENCQFRISSGTEGGHQTHGVGQPVVDIVPKNLQQSTLNKLKLLANDNNVGYGVAHCEAQGGASINNCAVPPANHIHVSFPLK